MITTCEYYLIFNLQQFDILMDQKCVKMHLCKVETEKVFQNRNHQQIFNLSFMWNKLSQGTKAINFPQDKSDECCITQTATIHHRLLTK